MYAVIKKTKQNKKREGREWYALNIRIFNYYFYYLLFAYLFVFVISVMRRGGLILSLQMFKVRLNQALSKLI